MLDKVLQGGVLDVQVARWEKHLVVVGPVARPGALEAVRCPRPWALDGPGGKVQLTMDHFSVATFFLFIFELH